MFILCYRRSDDYLLSQELCLFLIPAIMFLCHHRSDVCNESLFAISWLFNGRMDKFYLSRPLRYALDITEIVFKCNYTKNHYPQHFADEEIAYGRSAIGWQPNAMVCEPMADCMSHPHQKISVGNEYSSI